MDSWLSRPTTSAPWPDDTHNSSCSLKPRAIWLLIYCVVIFYLILLSCEVLARMVFPWDLLTWPESPFLTDMMKLNDRQSVYSTPADVNSFVYSPGLEYLTFALLRPFNLALDIRFCRLVNVVLGILAALVGALVVWRLIRSVVFRPPPRSFLFISWGIMWLVLSTNFLSDVTHPDNIHALLAFAVFLLCFTALETRHFGFALAAMGVAGVGVFTKQTGAVCILGPAFVFGWFNYWGWRRWWLLGAVGIIALGISIYLLWLPTFGRFFTLDLLSGQRIDLHKLLDIIRWLPNRRRLLLVCLFLIASLGFWQAGGACRRYLICWCGVGCFAVGPNVLAYIKTMGTTNNLCLFEMWMLLLAWPALVIGPDSMGLGNVSTLWKRPAFQWSAILFMAGYVLALVPHKQIPSSADYEFCSKVEAAVRKDIQSGRKVLVPHGTACLIRSGVTQAPLDRANTAIEMVAAKRAKLLSGMEARIAAHYYDTIYLTWGSWYGTNMLEAINKSYAVKTAIPYSNDQRSFFGYGGVVAYDSAGPYCKVLTPK